MTTTLVCDALRQRPHGVIVHSDHGSQHCSHEHRALLDEHGLLTSMSAKGNCYNNAAMESWNHPQDRGSAWRTLRHPAHAKAHMFDYIDVDYNGQRLHSTRPYWRHIAPLCRVPQ
jgi:putative transposase